MPCVGYETTSVALTYAVYAIASHPEVEEKLLQEVDAFWCAHTAQEHRPKAQHIAQCQLLEHLRHMC